MVTKQKKVGDILFKKKGYVTPQASLTGVDWPVLMLYTSVSAEHTTEGWDDDEDRNGSTGTTTEVDGTGWF